jgi:D-alanyl-D-alanine carboxypeptidase
MIPPRLPKIARHAVLTAVLACTARAGAPDAAEERTIADFLSRSGAPSVSVAVVEHGKLVYAKAFGKAALSPDRAADTSTRYFVGSITKQFTAAAILLAAEDGKLSLDDHVAKYYPALTRSAEITIRQLLSHTSGYEDFAPQDYLVPEWTHPMTPDAVIEAWAGKPLDFEPGTRWQYSNTNYVLAARIFEKATGEALGPFLRRRIFDPLGMTTAGDGYLSRLPTDAVPYTRYALGPARPATPEAMGWYFGAAQLAMSPSDLARWDIAVLHHRILNQRSYRAFTGEVRLKNGDRTGYALGLSVGAMDGIPSLSHGGEVSGFLTANSVYPTRDAAVVVCSNEDSVSMVGPIATQVARWLMEPDARAGPSATANDLGQISLIVDGLRQGLIVRSLFTSNANSYFSDAALADIQASLKPYGAVKSTERTEEKERGGMTYRFYRVQMEFGTVGVRVYLTPDRHFEQFMIEQDL